MTPEAFQRWQSMRGPVSHWRQDARAVMIRVVREQRDLGKLDDDTGLLKAIDAAYPFGERKYLPYKMWLLERKLFRDACAVPAATPSREEADVCSVARDELELHPERADLVRAFLDEHAPNRLARKCPACGVRAGMNCDTLADDGDPPARELLVPHESRLVGHRDAGPLFTAGATS